MLRCCPLLIAGGLVYNYFGLLGGLVVDLIVCMPAHLTWGQGEGG